MEYVFGYILHYLLATWPMYVDLMYVSVQQALYTSTLVEVYKIITYFFIRTRMLDQLGLKMPMASVIEIGIILGTKV